MLNPFIPVIQSILPEPEASLLLGMLFGIKANFSPEFYQALLTTGTVHVVALSGMNISILINVIGRVTYFLGKKLSILTSICGIVGFIIFVGLSPSVVRAAIMGILALTAVYFGRKSTALVSLFIAGGVMLIIKPALTGDLSFQLSFAATLSIMLFAGTVRMVGENRDILSRLWFIMKENLFVSLAAQVLTLPIIVFNFGRLSLISPVVNVLIGPVVAPITILGLAVALVGYIYIPLGYLGAWFVYPMLWYFVTVVNLLAKVPFASISFH